MADAQLRDLGDVVPGRDETRGRAPVDAPPARQDAPRRQDPPLRREEPSLRRPQDGPPSVEQHKSEQPKIEKPKTATPAVLVTPPPPPKLVLPVFAGDRSDGADAMGVDETLVHLAELAIHKRTQAPLCIGLIGGAGTGKSFALRRLVDRIRDLAAAAGKPAAAAGRQPAVPERQLDTPFLPQVHVETVDAATLDGDPALALAARLHAGLRHPYPDLTREIAAGARDPQVVLRDAEDKLDEIRRRLDTERRARDDAGSRRARLTETVLYEASGSQVDAYARANRAGIEARLSGFGITGDSIRNYKDLVQVAAGSGGVAGLALRSVWAFKGQLKLLVVALVLVLVGYGLGTAIDDQAGWLGQLHNSGKAGAPVADWLQAHMGLIAMAKSGAYVLALLAILANVLRAFAFLRPIRKGARLLVDDLESRSRDLDGLCAHQTKRVDALEADADRLTRVVAEAERRLGGGTGTRPEPSPFEVGGAATQAQTFFATLATAMAETRSADTRSKAPQRIVLALDHLDAVPPDRARALLDAVHRVASSDFVAIIGLDPARLGQRGASNEDLERWIHVPLHLDAMIALDTGKALVRDALGHGGPAETSKIDPRQSDLDAPIEDEEAAMLAALSALAGRTPRTVKRFVNLYRLARLGEERHLGALAFMMALAQGGTAAERAAVADAFATDAEARFDLPASEKRLRAALDAAVAVAGRFTRGEAVEAARRASAFSLTPLVA